MCWVQEQKQKQINETHVCKLEFIIVFKSNLKTSNTLVKGESTSGSVLYIFVSTPTYAVNIN